MAKLISNSLLISRSFQDEETDEGIFTTASEVARKLEPHQSRAVLLGLIRGFLPYDSQHIVPLHGMLYNCDAISGQAYPEFVEQTVAAFREALMVDMKVFNDRN